MRVTKLLAALAGVPERFVALAVRVCNAYVARSRHQYRAAFITFYDYDMPLSDAVAAMRFHHQLLPVNTIFWEPYKPIEGELAKQVEAKGYTLEGQDFVGDIQVIKVNGNVPEAATDPRGRGVARVLQ